MIQGGLVLVMLGVAVVLSALFSGAETGFYTVSRLRLRVALEEGQRSALRLHDLMSRRALLLSILLIGNNLSLELVTLSTQLLLSWHSGLAPGARATVGAVVATPLVFVLCEALPKSVFLARPYRMLSRISWLLIWMVRIIWPLGIVVTRAVRAVASPEPVSQSRVRRAGGLEPALRAGLREGFLRRTEHLLAANILRFGTLRARDVAVQSGQLPTLTLPAHAETWAAALVQTGEARALVHDAGGRVVGMVHAVDLALAVAEGREDLAMVVRPVPEVAPDLPVADLLEKMLHRGMPLAVLRPVRPGESALVRVQDVVEEVVGRLERL